MAASSADNGSSAGFLVVVAACDGSLHLYHGSALGVFPRPFYKPAPQAAESERRRRSSIGGSKLLGALGSAVGSAVKAMYNDAFDPLWRVQRSAPSSLAALQLHLRPVGAGRWWLLVLAPDALDCWQLGAPGGGTSSAAPTQSAREELLWSYDLPGVLSREQRAAEVQPLALACSADSQTAFVLSQASATASPGPASAPCYALSALNVQDGILPFYKAGQQLDAAALQLPPAVGGGGAHSRWALAGQGSSQPLCLLLAPNGSVVEWVVQQRRAQLLAAAPGNTAISCAPGGGRWQLLSATFGVLEMAAQLAVATSAQQSPQGAAPLPGQAATGPQLEAQVVEVLDATLSLMAKERDAGAPASDLAASLGARLARIGVTDASEHWGVLQRYSASIVDQMAKTGAPGLTAESLREQLVLKQRRHGLLLLALAAGDVMPQLQPGQLRTLFQHAEELAAVAGALTEMEEAGQPGDAGGSGDDVAAAAAAEGEVRRAVVGAVEAAGALARLPEDAVGVQSWEIFFSRPTSSAPALFDAVASAAGAAVGGPSVGAALQQLRALCKLLLRAASAAEAERNSLEREHRPQAERIRSDAALDGGWLCSDGARRAWAALAAACVALKQRLAGTAGAAGAGGASACEQRRQLASDVHLPATQALLMTGRYAMSFSRRPGTLYEEYWQQRQEHLSSLLGEAAAQLAEGGGAALAAGRELARAVEAAAAANHANEQLFDACELLTRQGLSGNKQLHHYMRVVGADALAAAAAASAGGAELLAAASSFASYVMGRLLADGQHQRLLQLGRERFWVELQACLAPHPELLWMSQTQAGQVAEAAASLLTAGRQSQSSTAKRRRLMCLAKLSGYAAAPSAWPSDDSDVVRTADAELLLLHIQALLQLGQLPPQTPQELVQAALERAREEAAQAGQPGGPGDAGGGAPFDAPPPTAVLAVQALAAAPPEVRGAVAGLWQEAWRAVLAGSQLPELAVLAGIAGVAEPHVVVRSLLYQALVAAFSVLAQAPGGEGARQAARHTLRGVMELVRQEVAADPLCARFVEDVFAASKQAMPPWLVEA